MLTRRHFMAGSGLIIAGHALAEGSFRNARQLDSAIDDALAERRITGCVVMIAQDGVLRYSRAAGHADREEQRAMEIGTPFRYASVTKLLTTLAALRLIESGKISPAELVSDWLPGFQPQLPEGEKAAITIGHLLSHTAGLDYAFQQPLDGPYRKAGVSDGLDEPGISLEENIRRISSVPLFAPPGKSWRYSVAADVLGAVLAKVMRTELDDVVQSLVTRPLGLDVRYVWDRHDLAKPYYNTENGLLPVETGQMIPLPFVEGPGVRFDPARIWNRNAFQSGGAGMAGTVKDVLHLLECYRAGSIISAETRELAIRERVGAEAETMGPGWGYSWMGARLSDRKAAQSPLSEGSVSWGGVYGHSWAVDFDRRLSVVVMTNAAYEGMIGKLPNDIYAALG